MVYTVYTTYIWWWLGYDLWHCNQTTWSFLVTGQRDHRSIGETLCCPEETGLLHFVNLHRHYPPPHVPLSSLGSLLGRWSGCRRTIRNHPTPSRRGHRICCPASIPAQCPREPSTHHLRQPMKWMRDSEALRIQISNYIICMLSTFCIIGTW